ncbi:hypothetical protein SNE40_020413 [Patella caerulea]
MNDTAVSMTPSTTTQPKTVITTQSTSATAKITTLTTTQPSTTTQMTTRQPPTTATNTQLPIMTTRQPPTTTTTTQLPIMTTRQPTTTTTTTQLPIMATRQPPTTTTTTQLPIMTTRQPTTTTTTTQLPIMATRQPSTKTTATQQTSMTTTAQPPPTTTQPPTTTTQPPPTTTQPPPTTTQPPYTMNSEVPMPTTMPTSTDGTEMSTDGTVYTPTTTEPETSSDNTTPPPSNTTTATPNTTVAKSSTTTKPNTTPTQPPEASNPTDGAPPRQKASSPPYYLIGVILFLITVVIVVAFFLLYKRSSRLTERVQRIRSGRKLTKITRKRPIVLSKMKAEVETFHRDDNRLIALQYEDLTKLSPQFNCSEAKKEENMPKNRYINIHPFDHTRVCLPIKDDDVNSDYINANYIPGYTLSKEYIATQGPLPDTINDFWKMIWHEKVSIIVMLTSLKEGHTLKCEQYWPDEVDEVTEYEQYTVEKVAEVTKKTHTCSTLTICCNEDSQNNKQTEGRTVKHFHYSQWKDKSAELEKNDILQFIRTVRQNMKSNDTAPVVVHCSAGVGRTGTYIALDYIQQYIDQHDLNKTIDIYEYVLKLRNNRVLMVQTETQFAFLYDCAVKLVEDKQNKTHDIESDQQTNAEDPVYENTCSNNGVMTTVI